MGVLSCQSCGHQAAERVEVCPQCGRAFEPEDVGARSIEEVRWAVQALGGLIAVIGVCVFLALFGPDLAADQKAILWRVGSLFVVLGIGVSVLGRVGLRP